MYRFLSSCRIPLLRLSNNVQTESALCTRAMFSSAAAASSHGADNISNRNVTAFEQPAAATEPTDAATPGSDQPDVSILLQQMESSFAKEREGFNEKLADLDDRYRRALAETENVRRRFQKQVDDARHFGTQSFCKDLLEVADILSLAISAVPVEKLSGTGETTVDPHFKSLFEGLKMTETELLKVFARNGLKQLNPEGEKFDPNSHDALFEIPTEEPDKAGLVANVTKIGYSLNDRVIRPAAVGVFKKV